MSWTEIEVFNTAKGQPFIRLHGKADEILKSRTPSKSDVSVHLSLSDSKDMVNAFVVIESY